MCHMHHACGPCCSLRLQAATFGAFSRPSALKVCMPVLCQYSALSQILRSILPRVKAEKAEKSARGVTWVPRLSVFAVRCEMMPSPIVIL